MKSVKNLTQRITMRRTIIHAIYVVLVGLIHLKFLGNSNYF